MKTDGSQWLVDFDGPIVLVGLGSIGRGLLPLMERHVRQAAPRLTVIDPSAVHESLARQHGAQFLKTAITPANYQSVLQPLLGDRRQRGLIINVANEVSSKALALFAAANNAHYIDTVVEPWPGFYFNPSLSKSSQSNYALRESLADIKPRLRGAPTAISCCGANPGMVSWFVKQALLQLAHDTGRTGPAPQGRAEWAALMEGLGVKGIHIAERDTQTSTIVRQPHQFLNTWSAEGCLAECLQPAELGWGTHETNWPQDGHRHLAGNRAAIYLDTPGGAVKVQTWTPTAGAHFGYLITHNEAISVADYYTVKTPDGVRYRPTCHYAYHPSETAVAGIEELFNERAGIAQSDARVLDPDDISGGADELGVLLYGHAKGAYWYGSRLTIEEARELAPHQNATGLQVSSAVLAGMVYAIRHPDEGLLEADEMDFAECLAVQRPYLGRVFGAYTSWQPVRRPGSATSDDPWQFDAFRLTRPRVLAGPPPALVAQASSSLKPSR